MLLYSLFFTENECHQDAIHGVTTGFESPSADHRQRAPAGSRLTIAAMRSGLSATHVTAASSEPRHPGPPGNIQAVYGTYQTDHND
jgi:hypothetical protein